jgi:sec-independent protein translocase protein TatA
MTVGPWQLLVIALLVLVVFGAGRLGEIGKGLGEGLRSLQKGLGPEGGRSPKRRVRRKPRADSDPELDSEAEAEKGLPPRRHSEDRADETLQRRHVPAKNRPRDDDDDHDDHDDERS